MFTHPRVASSFYPWHYTQSQQKFLDELRQQKNLSPQQYWQFREFYSTGNFSFNPEIVTFGETQKITTLPHDQNLLLSFESPRLSSKDWIVKINPAKPIGEEFVGILLKYDQEYNQDKLIFSNETTRIFKTSQGQYFLIFAKTIDEMKTANGFFDYVGSEQTLLENTVWVNETRFW